MPFLSTYIDIHLIPKWRRPRMVWVELHENEASRATEHKRFYTIGNHREMDRHTANSGKKAPKQRISLVAYRTSKSQDFSFGWTPSRDPDSPRSKLFLLSIARIAGEVEYGYCGPSCTAGKSGFCNHILALMCPLVWLLYCLYQQRAKRGKDYVWWRSLGYPPWETVLLLFKKLKCLQRIDLWFFLTCEIHCISHMLIPLV